MGRATETAANIGRGFGYLLIGFGVLKFASGFAQGIWLAVIGFFLVSAAGAQSVSARVRTVFAGVDASSLLSSPVATIPAEISLDRAVRDYFVPSLHGVSRGRCAGPTGGPAHARPATGSPRRAETGSARRGACRARSAADDRRAGGRQRIARTARLARVGRAVVLDPRGVPVGLLSITDVERSMRAFRLSQRPNVPGAPHADQSAAR